MNDKVIQSFAQSWLSRVAVQAVATLVFGGVLCCLMVGIASIPESLANQDVKLFLFIGSFACLMGAVMVGLLAWVLLNNRRIYAQFDQAFASLGLTRSRYLLRGLQYQGTYRGRQVNVYYHVSGGRYLRVPNLEIYLNGNFRTRLGIGTQNALSSLGSALLQQQALDPGDPAYEGLLIYPLDERWSRHLLGDHAARDAIVRLVGKDTPGVRGLHFGPESIRLQLRHFSLSILTPETVRQWLDDLFALAEIGEGLPPPAQTAQASDWERAGRSDRGRFLLPALGIVLLLVLCIFVFTGCVFLTLFLSGNFA
jgi:hypothetical protein